MDLMSERMSECFEQICHKRCEKICHKRYLSKMSERVTVKQSSSFGRRQKYTKSIFAYKSDQEIPKMLKKTSDVHHNCMTPGNDKDDIGMLGKIRGCLVSDDKEYRQ